MTTAQLNLTTTIRPPALVTPVSSDAVVGAGEPSGTATELLVRIYGNMRKRAVQDAILMELVERNNGRIAAGKPPIGRIGATPRPPLYYLENSMKHARAHDKKAWDMLQAEKGEPNPPK